MKRGLVVATLATGVALAFTVSVANAGNYGMAGCGLGSLVFGPGGELRSSINNTKVSEVLAATTNGTFGSQTFGISTGTSNCTEGGVVTSQNEARAFAEVNLGDLSRDIAAGGGDYLTAFGTLLGCDGASQSRLATESQARYETIFPSTGATPDQVLDALTGLVRSDAELAQGCAVI